MSVTVKTKRVSEKDVIASAPTLCVEEGERVYLCIGPHTWGRASTAAEALKNARKNRVKIYEGARGWCWLLFDARADVHVDEMGDFVYDNLPASAGRAYFEVAAFNMPAEHTPVRSCNS